MVSDTSIIIMKLTPGQKLAEAMKGLGIPYETITVTVTPEMKRTDKWIRKYIQQIDKASKSAKRTKVLFK